MFYLTTHSTHFIYGYMASDTWLRTILIVRKDSRCRHIGYSYRLTARVLLYAPSHRQDNTYHGLCYTSCGELAGMRNSSMGPPWRIYGIVHIKDFLLPVNTLRFVIHPDVRYSVIIKCRLKTVIQWQHGRKEGNVLFNDALNTFYLRLYGVRLMVKDHSNLLPPHTLLFLINSKGSFICIISQTG